MIEIKFPDNSKRNFEKGTTVYEVAKSISEGLAKMSFPPNIMIILWKQHPSMRTEKFSCFTWNNKQGKLPFGIPLPMF